MTPLEITLPTPSGWAAVPQEPDEDGFAPVVLCPEPWPEGHGFRPSIVAAASPPYDPVPSVRAAGSQAAAVALALEDSRLLAYDVWTVADQEARRLVFAYLTAGTAVCVTQVVTVHAGRSVTVTASADTDRWERVQPAVDEAVAGLRVSGGGA